MYVCRLQNIFCQVPDSNIRLSAGRSRSEAATAVESVRYTRGTTNTAGALNFVRNSMFNSGSGDRSNSPNIVVVMTDGGSNDREKTQEEAYKVGSYNITTTTATT